MVAPAVLWARRLLYKMYSCCTLVVLHWMIKIVITISRTMERCRQKYMLIGVRSSISNLNAACNRRNGLQLSFQKIMWVRLNILRNYTTCTLFLMCTFKKRSRVLWKCKTAALHVMFCNNWKLKKFNLLVNLQNWAFITFWKPKGATHFGQFSKIFVKIKILKPWKTIVLLKHFSKGISINQKF